MRLVCVCRVRLVSRCDDGITVAACSSMEAEDMAAKGDVEDEETKAAGAHDDEQAQGKSSGDWRCALREAALAKTRSAPITTWKDVTIVRTASGGSM